MAITIEVEVHQTRVLPDGDIQSHETHFVLEDGVRTGSFNHVRLIDMEGDVTTESPLVKDLVGGLDTPARRQERADARAARAANAQLP
jgi:hypothetical protein